MADWFEIALKVGSIVTVLAITVYMTRANTAKIAEIEKKIGPEITEIKISLSAIRMHLDGVVKLESRFDEDHDKVVLLEERTSGLQKGLNSVRKDYLEHNKLYHSKS